jgi:thiol-disulfide isomerase/thioredoxin
MKDEPGKSTDFVSVAIVGCLLLGALFMGFQEVSLSRLLPERTPAPDFTLKNLEGADVTLSSLRGKIVLLDFWATWCPPCRDEMPYLTRLAKEYESRGVTLVAVDNDDLEEQELAVKAFARRVPEISPYVVYGTPEVGATFKVRSLPTLYVIDREGLIQTTKSGQVSEAQLRRFIERALEDG